MVELSPEHYRALAAAETLAQEYLTAAGHEPVTGLGQRAVEEYLRVVTALPEHLVSEALRKPFTHPAEGSDGQ